MPAKIYILCYRGDYLKKFILLALLTFFVQTVEVTAYTASVEECGKADGITASGAYAVQGVTIAADHLPFGTVVEIDGHYYVVQDRFGGGYTNKIDIFFSNYHDAIQFGRQVKEIKVFL